MFGAVARFELRQQLRSPVFWIVFAISFLMVFGSMTVEQIRIGSGGNVLRNSPFAIATVHMVWTVFFIFTTTAFVADAVIRDDATGFAPIVRSTRIGRFDYVIGRFAGAYLASVLCFVSVPLAIWLGSLMPWVDPETLGPNRPEAYAFAFFVLAVPGLLVSASVFFALATVTRSMMGTYVGVIAFLVAYGVTGAVADRPEWKDIVALLEPFGGGAYALATEYWTPAERNARTPALEGVLLQGRLLWIGVSAALLALTYRLFRFEARAVTPRARRSRPWRRARETAAPPLAPVGPLPRPRFDRRAAWAQLAARTRFEMGRVVRSPAFAVLLALGMVNAGAQLWGADELYGAAIFPVTRVMIGALEGAFTVIPFAVAIFYAGELVWGERDRRMHEITGASAAPDWAFLLPKVLALVLVMLALLLASVAAAVIVQALKGYTQFELGKYLGWYVLPWWVDWTLFAVLAVFLQAVSPSKFVGWGLMVLYLIASLALENLGLDHNLYSYGATPHVPLSDMNGQGDFWKGAAWFRAYWSAFALALLMLAYALWGRGTESRLKPRLARLPARLKGPAGLIGGGALAAFAGLGAFIFLNTNVWNEYRSRPAEERFLADYEKALLPYERTPQPAVAEVRLEVELHPHAPRAVTRGAYVLENRTGAPLSQVHLRLRNRDLELRSLTVEGARRARVFEDFDYRVFTFDRAMAPGERRTVRFTTELAQRGFSHDGGLTNLVDNGTFLNHAHIAPVIGMTRDGLLQDRAKRRKHGLPPELRMAKLGDQSARARNYIRADWVKADITVSTVAGQTPIAPGYKVGDVTRDGRRTARFVTEAPILHFFSIQSADYAVKREIYKGVDLTVHHDRQHPYNAPLMIAALKAGLDYYQANFGPYQFRQARILEFPDYDKFAQAFANTMPYSEGLGFIADFEDPAKIDYVTYVTAHELAHQWWAHQVVGADMQGSTALSETLAQYSALMVMEKLQGPDKIRRFLKYELDQYLGARGSEAVEELPLIRVENQGYIHYNKGSLVMYLLKDAIGEDAVNRALRRVLDAYRFQGAPYPTSVDLVRALRAEAGPEHQGLITDLFEKITVYDLKTTEATARRRPDGRWDVTMMVEAAKLHADGQGRETPAPLNEVIDVGVFTEDPGGAEFDRADVAAFERRRLRSGAQTLSFTVAKKPTHAGVDPYNKRIDRDSDDNLIRVD